MPDWFYRTLARPALFSVPHAAARDFALGFMGRLARLPGGGAVIDFLGHMRADARLARRLLGVEFATPIGLGCGLDTAGIALPALARFGVGFLELGPVTPAGQGSGQGVRRLASREALAFAQPPDALSLAVAAQRACEAADLGVPLIARLGCAESAGPEQATADAVCMIGHLGECVPLLSLTSLSAAVSANWSAPHWQHHVRAVAKAAGRARGTGSAARAVPVLLVVPADAAADRADELISAALAAGIAGLHVDGSLPETAEPDDAARRERVLGRESLGPVLSAVRRLRSRLGAGVPILAAGGVHQPRDALELSRAGADLIAADTGLVFTGPSLPKRLNDVLLHEAELREAELRETELHDERPSRAAREADREPEPRVAELSWLWLLLMGAGMLIGSVMAVAIAATRVVLPYDEAFVGMSRAELDAVNPRLLAFMAHDRVSVAGTMVAVGLLYVSLSVFGVRRGRHWAQVTVLVSAFTGFASFFLFLGYGYLDTLHAFVTAVLLQLLLLGLHSRLGPPAPQAAPLLESDWAWRLAQWGQLLSVAHGGLLLLAGAVISTVGATVVFVPEDLAFMGTTSEALAAANPRLIPLVAHDRATFGGMLLAAGWAFVLPALWGWRNGRAWLWWTLAAAGTSAYAAGLAVHYAVGYTDMHHLLPAWAGLGVLWLGLALSYPYLCRSRQLWPPRELRPSAESRSLSPPG